MRILSRQKPQEKELPSEAKAKKSLFIQGWFSGQFRERRDSFVYAQGTKLLWQKKTKPNRESFLTKPVFSDSGGSHNSQISRISLWANVLEMKEILYPSSCCFGITGTWGKRDPKVLACDHWRWGRHAQKLLTLPSATHRVGSQCTQPIITSPRSRGGHTML